MAQTYIDQIKNDDVVVLYFLDDVSVTDISPNLIVCCLGLDQEAIVKKVKNNVRIVLKEKGKTVRIPGDFLKKLLSVSESLLCVCAFVGG